MINPPNKSGWYWVLKLDYGSLPEVCFWTGRSFLTIHPNQPELHPDQIALCGDEPLRPPENMTN
jgi:hypothetical protein